MAKVRILDLRPTQFAVGMYEVTRKIKALGKLNDKDVKAYLKDHRVPVVVAPHGDLFITDRHHLLTACWMVGIKKGYTETIADFSKRNLSFNQFWGVMIKKRWCHLYDQFGHGPHSPIYLPHNVRGLADDPYRSLAWLVRQTGAFKDTGETFAEFRWAGFFRTRRLLDRRFVLDFDSVLEKACELARTPAARRLPGWLGKLLRQRKTNAPNTCTLCGDF